MTDKNAAYCFGNIEQKWQERWEKEKHYRCLEDPDKPRQYILEMFPYPSGKLHMGHVRVYSIGDVMARFFRMQGYNVLHPIGYDAFGLPAENAAKENQVHPEEWTRQCIALMNEQQKKMGLSYDWDRLVATCLPEYYRWNQWIFLQMYKKGLAYKKKAAINWCPQCETVLANEQVESNRCWRCNSEVHLKDLEQWFFKISQYADELLDDLDSLPEWPEKVKLQQVNWIGKSYGTQIQFNLEKDNRPLPIFTTRPDTLYGVTYLVIAPEHPLLKELIRGKPNEKEVLSFIEKTLKQEKFVRGTQGKEGIFLGEYAIHPLTNEKIPIYTANFVLMEYGTGMIMAVPAHDQRDYEFAEKYDIPVRQVISADGEESPSLGEAYVDEGILLKSGEFSGIPSTEARRKITEKLEKDGKGEGTVQYKLRDWLISRQRYWGTPIPVINCPLCGIVPVPEEDLPVKLPLDVEFTGSGNPLATSASFKQAPCPECGKMGARELDTMDTFVDSSWYFLRYCDSKNAQLPFAKEKVDYWCPVDHYIGGIEHAILHLLYARFFTKVLRDIGLTQIQEPFSHLLTQGMVTKDGGKMSKSLGNTVDPGYIIDKYGADTARLFILFAAPPEKDLEWLDSGVEGCFRFINRFWRLVQTNEPLIREYSEMKEYDDSREREKELLFMLHTTLKKVTDNLQTRFHFNSCVAAIMELVNYLGGFAPQQDSEKILYAQALEYCMVMAFPFIPHVASELWEQCGKTDPLDYYKWPDYNEKYLILDAVEIVLQVNGKIRSKVNIPRDISEQNVWDIVDRDEKIQQYLSGKKIVKKIYVPGKLVNIVVK